eukprot:scaffold36009_cov60-Phaeocystis_antarctica.AAC.3
MQVEPAPHGRGKAFGPFGELHHRGEVDALVRHVVVLHATDVDRRLGSTAAAGEEDVHLARRHACSAQLGQQPSTRLGVRRRRVDSDVEVRARRRCHLRPAVAVGPSLFTCAMWAYPLPREFPPLPVVSRGIR